MTSPLQPAYRTRIQAIAGMDQIATELGRDLAPMLARYGLPPAPLCRAEADIPYSAMCALVEGCALEWHCPDLGLRLARLQNLDILGPLGLAVRLAATVEQAMARLAEHMSIHSTGFHTYIEKHAAGGGGQASLVFIARPGAGAGRQVVENALSVARNIFATLAGPKSFKPGSVSLQHGAPPLEASAASVRRYFDCPVMYGESLNALHFDAGVLGAPNLLCDMAYAPLIEAYMASLRPQPDMDIVHAVRNRISNLIATGNCSLAGAAACFRVHPRTLQRRLRDQGTSFAEILDGYRETLALDLVGRQSMPLIKIADALGYADQSTFNQAFRRWTATTPTLYAAGRRRRDQQISPPQTSAGAITMPCW
jgi:AraC-like DNA-binding protein